jgi:E3 ubiquitin-protein ligase MYCBP2
VSAGVRGEEGTKWRMPCLRGCDGVRVDGDELCSICFTDPIAMAPSVRLKCGHAFHAECVRMILQHEWWGKTPYISWQFLDCPICARGIEHPWDGVSSLVEPLVALRAEHKRRAVQRLRFENLHQDSEITEVGGRFFKDPEGYAMHHLLYYQCFKCKKPYYGGRRHCGVANAGDVKKEELICPSCLPQSEEKSCPKHGTEFIQWKCQFCCSIAVFFCFGTTHFCGKCHDMPSQMQDMARTGKLPKCPAGPQGKQLAGECPLGVPHPEPGVESALGCSVCSGIRGDF